MSRLKRSAACLGDGEPGHGEIAHQTASASSSTKSVRTKFINPRLFYIDEKPFVVQLQTCNSVSFKPLPQCRNCISRLGNGDSCRFRDIRAVPVRFVEAASEKAKKGKKANAASKEAQDIYAWPPEQGRDEKPIFLTSPFENQAAEYAQHHDLNRPMEEATKAVLLKAVGKALLPIMLEAREVARQLGCIRRQRELQYRALCDMCNTGLFASSYLCTLCGLEYCLACRDDIVRLSEVTASSDKKPDQLFYCAGARNRVGNSKGKHLSDDLIPVTRFGLDELNAEIASMQEAQEHREELRLDQQGSPRPSQVDDSSGQLDSSLTTDDDVESVVMTQEDFWEPPNAQAARMPSEPIASAQEICASAASTEQSSNSLFSEPSSPLSELATLESVPQLVGASSHVPTHELVRHSSTSLTEDAFLQTWSRGEPLLVFDVRTAKSWRPEAFQELYGAEQCEIVRCDVDPKYTTLNGKRSLANASWSKVVTVHDFFATFGQSEEERSRLLGEGIWKLKDWPPSAEFQTSFPDIHEDFNAAVPMPDYTRRDGCKNLSALFPLNANGPDLGPKMYNAWPGEHSEGKKGTTRLHMDIADAVNIMLYASESGEAVGAQWDLFRAEDAGKIRDFLWEQETDPNRAVDPIHVQQHYLDDKLLERLYASKGVYSWRIYQKPGDAVFIPAGCAHQVCNLSDCIKVAVDFISIQNIQRCFKLTEEFAALKTEKAKSWKEDVLQLRAQLWYAWKTCRQLGEVPTQAQLESQKARKRERIQQLIEGQQEEARLEKKRRRDTSAKEEKEDAIASASQVYNAVASTRSGRNVVAPPTMGAASFASRLNPAAEAVKEVDVAPPRQAKANAGRAEQQATSLARSPARLQNNLSARTSPAMGAESSAGQPSHEPSLRASSAANALPETYEKIVDRQPASSFLQIGRGRRYTVGDYVFTIEPGVEGDDGLSSPPLISFFKSKSEQRTNAGGESIAGELQREAESALPLESPVEETFEGNAASRHADDDDSSEGIVTPPSEVRPLVGPKLQDKSPSQPRAEFNDLFRRQAM